DWTMETIYRAPTISDAVQQIQMGLGEANLVTSAYLDAGYSNEHSEQLSRATAGAAYRSYYAAVGGPPLATVVALVRGGLAATPEIRAAIDLQGYTDSEVTTAVQVAALEETALFARRGRMRAKQRAAQSALAGYEVGVLARPTALGALTRAGYNTDAANALLT